MQHEREALGGLERVEHHQEREADRVGEQQLLFGVGRVPAVRARRLAVERLLAARLARAQHVQAYARDDGRQPALQVVDAAAVGAAEPEPGLLDRVLGLAERPEHPVGHPPQAAALGLEALRQPFVLVHRSHSPASIRHGDDEWIAFNVTQSRPKPDRRGPCKHV